MSSASEQADCALKELLALYDDAKLRSMIDGVVGKVLVSPGSVVRPGEPMIEIVGKHRFVVVWFPVSRLYRLQVGDAVTVSTGGATCPTKIAKVSVIADAAERIPERIRAHRRNTMALNEPTRPYGRILAGDGGPGPRFHLSARHSALPPEREWSAKRYPADALPFGMQYCLRKLREPAINENSCGRRSRLNSRGFARRSKKTHARCGHIGGLKLRSDDGGRREPSGY